MAFSFNSTTNNAASKPAGFGGSFAFGQSQATPAFGTAPAFGSTATATGLGGGFGGFGAQTATTSKTGLFGGTGAFGSTLPTTTTSSGLFGGTSTFGSTPAFGAAQTSTGFGGFGATPVSSAAPTFSSFGPAATTTPAPSFAGFGITSTAPTTGFGGFGGTFGSTFGKPVATAAPAFGGFSSFGPALSQPQQQQSAFSFPNIQQVQQQEISPDEAFAQSIFNVAIFNDERDATIAKWNFLQASWGTGKSFYSQVAAPVEITPDNYLCRFKSMGYSRLPGKDNKLGLVALKINKPHSEVEAQKHQLIASLGSIFGNKTNLQINIETMKALEENKSQVIMFLEEKSLQIPNETKRILATETAGYLNQPTVQPQLAQYGIVEVIPLVLPDDDQLKEYLENPPKGVHPRMWQQATNDNPNPKELIPVAMLGFNELKWRIKCQEQETEAHSLYLRKLEKDLSEMKQKHVATTAKIMERKRKLAELTHNILKIIVKQECTRKVGMALSPEEEALRSKLENMQDLISAPTQFKGRLSELLSQMRMQRNQYALTGANEYTIDKDSEDEMKSFLTMQQKAMEVLIETINKDLKALAIITKGMPELMRG